MKKILFGLLLLISTAATAQEGEAPPPPQYADSTITLQFTQRFAYWAGYTYGTSISIESRKTPDVIAPFIGSGTRQDSLFTVTLRAGIVKDVLELLLSRSLWIAYDDYRSIMLNSPAIPGYTSLPNQVTARAASSHAEKATAQWLLDWYVVRQGQFRAVYEEDKQRVIRWANQ